MYQLAFYAHVVLSLTTLLSGLAAILLAFYRKQKHLPFNSLNLLTNRIFVGSMYVQLFLGLLMYYNPWSDDQWIENNAIDPGNSLGIRFWEIEHVAIMIFALFLVQIGYVFVVKTKSHHKRFLLTIWYFGVSLALMIFTMIMALR
jgi:hypothetical protein